MTDGPLDERCPDCGALVDACRCPEPEPDDYTADPLFPFLIV